MDMFQCPFFIEVHFCLGIEDNLSIMDKMSRPNVSNIQKFHLVVLLVPTVLHATTGDMISLF